MGFSGVRSLDAGGVIPRAHNIFWTSALGLVAALGLIACDPPAPANTPVAEPTEALRPPDQRGSVPAKSRIADYVIDAQLDAEKRQVTGTVRITWRNRTTQTVDHLPLHLYMNAFRAEDTTWMAEGRGAHRTGRPDNWQWGYIDITSANLTELRTGVDAPSPTELQQQQPKQLEWKERDDPSLADVKLPTTVGPGQQVTIELAFVTQLPTVFARTGYHDDFFMVAQWFPKVGVLEETGWQAHVFTFHSEFYADFGNYQVFLDVPENMVVGASGIRTAEEVADGRKKLTYKAEMVHDFAWTADPDFVEYHRDYNGIRIRQLIQPEHVGDAEAHFEAQIETLKSMEKRFGPYPWSTITIVHAPDGGEEAGGMEYPTLYTTSDILNPGPAKLLGFAEQFSGRFTTVHEFGHQYFQGLLASNEFAQPWLDEGMNTTSNMLVMYDWHPDDPWVAKLGNQKLTIDDSVRMALLGASTIDAVDRQVDTYRAFNPSYGVTVYRKTAALMLTLRNLVGHEVFDKGLRAYADKYRFRHPKGSDLADTLIATIGRRVTLAEAKIRHDDPKHPESQPEVVLDVRDYLDQALQTVDAVDYKLRTLKVRRIVGRSGWHRNDAGELIGGEEPEGLDTPTTKLDDDLVETLVVIDRKGEFPVPVELEVEFEDGSTQRRMWDGKARYWAFTFPGKRGIRATIDPDQKLLLEAHTLDNTRTRKRKDDGLTQAVVDSAELAELIAIGGMGL